MKRHDQISSLVCLAIAVYLCSQSFLYTLGSWRYPGPGFFSFGIGALLGSFSIIVYIKARMSKSPETEESWYSKEKWKGLVLVLAALFAYAMLLEILGFLLSTVLLLFFLFKVVEPQSWIVAAGGSLLATFSSYALLKLLLQVRLPQGIWGF